MNLYNHLPSYRPVKIGIRIFYLPKLTIGKRIHFMVVYNQLFLKRKLGINYRDERKELLKIMSIQKVFISIKTQTILIEEMKNSISSDNTNNSKKSNPQWLSQIIAYLGAMCGWTKEDVLNLYPEEVETILSEIKIVENNQNISQLSIIHFPNHFIETISKSYPADLLLHKDEMDRTKIEQLKKIQ